MDGTVLALDVGKRRIGVARARLDVRIAQPLTTVMAGDDALPAIAALAAEQSAAVVVVGLPRGLSGQTTAQTVYAETFARSLSGRLACPIVMQDEALTSVKAEAELKARRKPYDAAAVDALAATYILEDYLAGMAPGVSHV